MAEIDSLEISIQSNIEKVNKNMDLLIKKMGIVAQGISAIGSNKGLDEFIKTAKTASESMGNMESEISKSMKPIEEQAKKISRTFEQVKESFKDLGKGFKVSGGIVDIQKSLQRYENELEKAKLKEQELSSKDMTDSKGYRDAVADIAKYENVIESLKKQLESINKIQVTAKIRIDGRESGERYLVEFKKEITDFKKDIGTISEAYGGIENVPKGGLDIPIENLTSSLAELKAAYPQATNVISAFEEELKNLQNISSKLTKEQIKVKVDEKPIKTATQSIRERIESLSDLFKESGKDFVFSGNTEQLEKQIQKVNAELDGLFNRQDKMIELGKVNTEPFKNLVRDIENARNRLEILENSRPEALNRTLQENAEKARAAAEQLKVFEGKLGKLQVPPIDETNLKKLQTSLKKTEENLEKLRFKLANGIALGKISANIDDSGYRNLREQIVLTEKQAEALREKIGNIGVFERLKQSMSGASSSSKQLQKAFSGLYATLKKIEKGIMSVLSKIGKLIKSMFSLGTATKKSSGGFNFGLKTILKYGFGIRSLYILVNKLKKAVREGMENLIQYSERTNVSVSTLNSSLSQFKNASAAAFAPILNTIAPALNQLIQIFIRATNAVNQFLSALTGSDTWIKAKYNYEDVADKIYGAADAAKGALQPFDKLNNLTTQKDAGAGGVNPGDMFETVPVSDKIKDFADKVKDILEKLFAPLKEAWGREGKFVMDSWKYALDEVWKLIKDIGRDFLTVWQQEKTIKIFEDILHIIGDIGLVIGHLARNFREAWNENETGLHILENIRDIIGVIVHNIRLAADFTVEWADKLNFSPILQAIERFTESLIPVADALSGVMMDFYTMVLLPLAKWTVEKGLPELLDVFTAFNEKVDWGRLRENLAEFWRHLEPFAETIGEGLIIFIERVSDAIANFINSETFVNFLHAVEDWMDSVTPEDVADGIENLAKAFIVFKVACIALQGILAGFDFATKLELISTTLSSLFGGGAGGASASGGFSGLITALSPLSAALIAIGAGLAYVFATNEEVRQSFANAINDIKEGLQPALQLITETIIPSLQSGWDTILQILTPLGEFLEGAFTSIWQDMINPALSYIGETVLPLLAESFKNLWNNVLVPLGNFLSSVLQPVIQIISDVLKMLWENVVVPLADTIGNVLSKAFEGLCDIFNNTVVPIVNTVIEVLQFLWDNVLSPIVNFLWDNLQPAFEGVFNFIGDIIDNFSQIFGGLIDFIVGVFTGDWEKAWEGIKNVFKGVFNTVVSIAETVINSIIGGLNKFLSGFNSIASKVGSKVGLNISIPTIPDVSLPKFATGAIVYKATYAEIGEKGKEGVVPLTNRAAMSQLVDEIMLSAGGSGQYNQNIGDGYLQKIEQATYRGVMRAIQDAGGIGVNANFQVEGDPNGLFNIVSQEVNTTAKRKGIAPPAVFA